MIEKKHILLVGPSLGRGGAERVMADMSIFLSSLGHKVTLITAYDDIDYSHKGNIISLGLKKKSSLLFFTSIKAFFLWGKLVSQLSPDVIIDSRARRNTIRELMIHLFIYRNKCRKIFMCHRSDLEIYFPKPRILFRPIYNKMSKIVSVSTDIENKLNLLGLVNTQTIYNGFDFNKINLIKNENHSFQEKYVLCVGRMDDNVKQFKHAIDCYNNSTLHSKNIHLVILGQGKLKQSLEAYARLSIHSKKIHFMGFVSNPYAYFNKADFLVLTSKLEGFPMVLIESLAFETPVVSYDCPTGPREIVQHEKNGLLVKANDKEMMTDAMNRMVQDNCLYKKLCANAKNSVAHLSMDKIAAEWQSLIDDI